MSDSLIIGNIIQLLAGGVASQHPWCPGAEFTLSPGFDLSAPQPTSDVVATLLGGGERLLGEGAANRTIKLPLAIRVNSTGNLTTDRTTLAGGRELLLATIDAPGGWQMVWERLARPGVKRERTSC